MNYYPEEDRLQCQAITTLKKRCTRIATHHSGGKLMCADHHVRYVNDKLIKKEKPSEDKR